MPSIVKIKAKPIQSKFDGLRELGLNRLPGTGAMYTPLKRGDRYVTGLDERLDANFAGVPAGELDQRRKAVADKRRKYAELLGENLDPSNGEFWGRQSFLCTDREIVFDLDDPEHFVTYSWLRHEPRIAKDLEQALSSDDYQFYIDNIVIEEKARKERKSKVNECVAILDKMPPEEMRGLSKLLGMPASERVTEDTVYNQLDDFIKDEKDPSKVEQFLLFHNMDKQSKTAQLLVAEALEMSVLKHNYAKKTIAFGDEEMIRSDWFGFLQEEANAATRNAIESRLKEARIMQSPAVSI